MNKTFLLQIVGFLLLVLIASMMSYVSIIGVSNFYNVGIFIPIILIWSGNLNSYTFFKPPFF